MLLCLKLWRRRFGQSQATSAGNNMVGRSAVVVAAELELLANPHEGAAAWTRNHSAIEAGTLGPLHYRTR